MKSLIYDRLIGTSQWNYIYNRRKIPSFVPPTRCTPSRVRHAIQCATHFRPCDIHKGKVKQIVGSTLRDSSENGNSLVTNFESDKSAAYYANMYNRESHWWPCHNAWCRSLEPGGSFRGTTCLSWWFACWRWDKLRECHEIP